MTKIRKFLPYLIFTFLLGLIVCMAVSFFIPLQEDVLSPFIFSWRLRQGLLLFILYTPIMFISAIILGYTIIFGKLGPLRIPSHAPEMLKFVRSFFIILISVAICYFLMSELLRPILIEKQKINLQKSTTYKEYNKLAEEAYNRKDFKQALNHIQRAIIVWPESEKALKLKEDIKIACANCSEEENIELIIKKTGNDVFESEYTAEQALKTAEKSMMILDFYTAHYYAKMAAKAFNNTNPLKEEAEILANKAWQEIQKGRSKYLEKREIAHFQKKKIAYETMQAGNFIEAYYLFLEINKELRQSNNDKKDPEIERFLKLSKVNLLHNVFFIDELKNIPNFEVDKNIEFLIDQKENIYMKIYGISRVTEKNKKVIYLMNTDITKKIGKNRIWSVRIPYAKLKKVNENELLLQIQAVDRQKRNKDLRPVILRGKPPIINEYNIKLDFGFNDFDLIEEASFGSENMKLPSLYYFIWKAEDYGFRRSNFKRELIFRISAPLLLMIMALYATILSWKFRLTPGKKFRKIWILSSPLCFGLAYVIVATTQYLYKLQTALFVYFTPIYAPYILIGILVIIFAILTIRLSAMSAE